MATRVFRDRRGSALPLMAAALLPTMLAIGGGIDMARAYMVKSKLQEAVDSAALAGRRSMTKEDIETAKNDVKAFLNFNFPTGTYQITLSDPVITKPDVGTVRVAVTATVRTTIMSLVGIKTIPISVVGEAKQNFDNVDIVLVLDTTGSMAGTKLDALKDAVRALYKELEPAQQELSKQGLRMRFGIVPYAATVNVGKVLLGKSSTYIQTTNLSYYHWRKANGNWSFGQRTYNLQTFVGGGALGNINGNGDNQTATWTGCIEERKTVNSITANDSRSGPPSDANDLNIDLIPGTDVDTKWRPYLFDPTGGVALPKGSVDKYCPSEVIPLKEMTSDDLDKELGKLVAQGSTYHDIGMIWGTRLISNGGVFGSGNPTEYKQRKVQKYIIYMTDGQISAPRDFCTSRGCSNVGEHSDAYSAWGIEGYDQRVGATSDSDSNDRHTKRFLMACNEAKAREVSIWTVAFGTGSVASLDSCASNKDQALVADDPDELVESFSAIGRNIGPLRISK
ncbi:TadE/TadG family type IV pilus assembly protein [Novosphingobium sp. JCM 18896]|uniref:TadE/TadG family type IV pilus assembly protein n=1 Tax=Novosphingobium sp. JCM 18896 TaxID=2989731 RepID=UPI002223258D|nr:TadE/TadG family type IV pilus assembly protein [Novosphingobium sp. JCM 18896]MCW1429878.1 TadE/TadG family protein [Novosphingobium sp. JCM 18896]